MYLFIYFTLNIQKSATMEIVCSGHVMKDLTKKFTSGDGFGKQSIQLVWVPSQLLSWMLKGSVFRKRLERNHQSDAYCRKCGRLNRL